MLFVRTQNIFNGSTIIIRLATSCTTNETPASNNVVVDKTNNSFCADILDDGNNSDDNKDNNECTSTSHNNSCKISFVFFFKSLLLLLWFSFNFSSVIFSGTELITLLLFVTIQIFESLKFLWWLMAINLLKFKHHSCVSLFLSLLSSIFFL